jgi:putative ubiquitin-RnfH superfamily antitoxin RatB of RatAB toxin-antitoxin module
MDRDKKAPTLTAFAAPRGGGNALGAARRALRLGDEALIRVAVACTPRPGVAVEVGVELDAGATALDAIRASGVLQRFAEIDVSTQSIGVWGRICALDAPLADGDRVEIYRPLAVDPKEARRRRAKKR